MKKLLAAVVVANLAACAATQVDPSASQIRLTHTEPGKECKFLGDITGNQGDFFTGVFTSNANLETGARNDLKNKARALGGNVVYLLTNRAGQTGSYDADYGGSSQQTNVTLGGNVYRCAS